MRIDRRKFLRFAGLSTLLGFTGISAIDELLRGGAEAATFTSNPASMSAKRWAMVIDMSKLKTETDYRKVINACHSIHNVPELDNKKHEIK
ncbi:MAG: 4Fe-4S ferredoxin, partial [Candidatus Mariimomonas ferrooxydans]